MIVPKGVDAHPYQLTEPRELVLRAMATDQGYKLDRPVAQPLPLRPQDVAEAMRWLHTHDYLDSNVLTNRGRQVAQHLSRANRHDPITDAVLLPDAACRLVIPGTRVRCTCGWGGARNEQGPADLRVPVPPHRGGRETAERLHAPHARAAKGEQTPEPAPKRDAFAGIPTDTDDDAW